MKNRKSKKKIVVAVSGGFDPLHIGHVDYFKGAKKLGDELVVIVNSNKWLVNKKGNFLMELDDRMSLIKEIGCVDKVVAVNTERKDIAEALGTIKPDIFAKGGDRRNSKEIPKEEVDVCKKYNIKMIFGIGEKIRSSSDLLKEYFNNNLKSK